MSKENLIDWYTIRTPTVPKQKVQNEIQEEESARQNRMEAKDDTHIGSEGPDSKNRENPATPVKPPLTTMELNDNPEDAEMLALFKDKEFKASFLAFIATKESWGLS